LILGATNVILWGEIEKIGGELLNWCYEGNVRVPPLVVERIADADLPIFLVSLPNQEAKLSGMSVIYDSYATKVFCLHPPEVKKQCDAGNRTEERKESSQLEKLLARMKLKNSL